MFQEASARVIVISFGSLKVSLMWSTWPVHWLIDSIVETADQIGEIPQKWSDYLIQHSQQSGDIWRNVCEFTS